MKVKIISIFLLFAFVFCAATEDSLSQKRKVKKLGRYSKSISADPFEFLVFNVFNATYEQRLSRNNSFTLFASYYNFSSDWTAFGIGASYRWYSDAFEDNKKALEGLSYGPMIRYSYWSFARTDYYEYEDYGGSYLVLGAEVAYKWIFDDFVVEPNIKIGFPVLNVQHLGYDPYGIGINIGYAWD